MRARADALSKEGARTLSRAQPNVVSSKRLGDSTGKAGRQATVGAMKVHRGLNNGRPQWLLVYPDSKHRPRPFYRDLFWALGRGHRALSSRVLQSVICVLRSACCVLRSGCLFRVICGPGVLRRRRVLALGARTSVPCCVSSLRAGRSTTLGAP